MQSVSKSTTNSLADWFLWPMPLRNKCIRGKISSFIASRKLIYGNTSVWIDQALDRQCRHYLNIFIWDFFFDIYIYIYRFAEEIETQALHFPNSCSCRAYFPLLCSLKMLASGLASHGISCCVAPIKILQLISGWVEPRLSGTWLTLNSLLVWAAPTLFCCKHVQANRGGYKHSRAKHGEKLEDVFKM